MKHRNRRASGLAGSFAALLAGLFATGASLAYKPEIGETIDALPVLQTGGRAVDWNVGGASLRILIIGTSWCPPCQDLRNSLPNELAGVNPSPTGTQPLEASLSMKLTKWSPRVLRLTTHKGGELTASRQADGSYAGTIFYGRSRPLVRHITLERMLLDEAEL